MVELHANGLRIPILFPVDANGFASVFSIHLGMRFLLQDSTIWVEREIYDSITSLLSFTIRENPRVADNISSMWVLNAQLTNNKMLNATSVNFSTTRRTSILRET
jgi:hypothetical protein